VIHSDDTCAAPVAVGRFTKVGATLRNEADNLDVGTVHRDTPTSRLSVPQCRRGGDRAEALFDPEQVRFAANLAAKDSAAGAQPTPTGAL